MRWFRLYTDILDDPKMFELTEFQFKTLILLMALASRLDKDGAIDLSEHGLRVSIHCPTPGLALSKCLSKLNQLGIISKPNLPFKFINWDKRQCKSDYSADRVKKHREMKLECNVTETLQKRTVDTDTDTDTDTELKPTTPEPQPDPEEPTETRIQAEDLCNFMLAEIQKTDPAFKAKSWPRWVLEMERLIRIDDRPTDEIHRMIEFTRRDTFWSGVILSAANLREHYPKILARMKNGGNNHGTNRKHSNSRDPREFDDVEMGQIATGSPMHDLPEEHS